MKPADCSSRKIHFPPLFKTIVFILWAIALWPSPLGFATSSRQTNPSTVKCRYVDETTFEEVVSAAANVRDEDREWMLADIAGYQANLGDIDSALRIVARMKDPPSINYTLSELALRQAETGDFSGARTTAQKIMEKHPYVLVQIAALQAEHGDPQGAFQAFPHPNSDDRDSILDGKVTYELRQGQMASALKTLESIHDKDASLWAIMFEQAKSGDVDAAFHTGSLIKDPTTSGQVRDGIVNARIEVGDFEGAKSLAVGLAPGFHVRVLYDIGEAQAKNGMPAAAECSFKEAAGLAFEVSPQFLGETLGTIAEHEIRLGLPVDVMKQIDSLSGGYSKRDALIAVGEAELAAGEAKEAELVFERAPYPPMVAVARATQGDMQGALQALKDSDSSVNIDAYLIDIAERLAQRREIAAAVSIIPEIDSSLKHEYQSESIQRIARARTENGESMAALQWARNQQDPLFKAMALLGVLQGNLERCQPGSTAPLN